MASIGTQSQETQALHRKLLKALLKQPENQECFDCNSRSPSWASINLGVFLCIRCAGLHRQLGVHISQVRSCSMDLWKREWITFVSKMGNAAGKKYYETTLPANYGKPSVDEDDKVVLQWLRVKYEQKKYWGKPEDVERQAGAEKAEQAQAQAQAGVENTATTITRKKKRGSGQASPELQAPQMASPESKKSVVHSCFDLEPAQGQPQPQTQAPVLSPTQPARDVSAAEQIEKLRQQQEALRRQAEAVQQEVAAANIENGRVRMAHADVMETASVSTEDEDSTEDEEPVQQMVPSPTRRLRNDSFLNLMQAPKPPEKTVPPMPAPFLDFSEPGPSPTSGQSEADFLLNLTASTAPQEVKKCSIMDCFDEASQAQQPAAPTGPPPIIRSTNVPPPIPDTNGQMLPGQLNQSDIERQIRQLQLMQENLTRQLQSGHSSNAGSGTASPQPQQHPNMPPPISYGGMGGMGGMGTSSPIMTSPVHHQPAPAPISSAPKKPDPFADLEGSKPANFSFV